MSEQLDVAKGQGKLIAHTGEVIDRSDIPAVALETLNLIEMKRSIDALMEDFKDELARYRRAHGLAGHFTVGNMQIEVGGDSDPVFSDTSDMIGRLEQAMRDAGVAQDAIAKRLSELGTWEYKPKVTELRRLAKANAAYAAIIAEHETRKPKRPYVSVKMRRPT